MRKIVNLADRKAAMELLKQLYGNDEVKDDQNVRSTSGEAGTGVASGMVDDSSSPEKILSQE